MGARRGIERTVNNWKRRDSKYRGIPTSGDWANGWVLCWVVSAVEEPDYYASERKMRLVHIRVAIANIFWSDTARLVGTASRPVAPVA